VIEDGHRHRAMLALGAESGALVAFTHDTRVVSLPRWRGAATRLLDERCGVFYDVGVDPGAVTIVSAPRNPRVRMALMRVVRELAVNRAQRTGGIVLHAAAFAAGGRGIVVAGPKCGGKTTLLLHALRTGSARYVSNDRVLVVCDRGRAVARGVPTIIALRRSTLDRFPAVAARLDGIPYHHRLTLAEAAALEAETAASRDDAGRLSPAQLCRVLDVAPLAEAEVSALLFPRITHEPGAFRTRRLSEGDTEALLGSAVFGATLGRWTSDVFTDPADPPAPDGDALRDRCRWLASRIPAFECRIGLDAHGPPRAADEMIASVLG
jgi:hypothetical protein